MINFCGINSNLVVAAICYRTITLFTVKEIKMVVSIIVLVMVLSSTKVFFHSHHCVKLLILPIWMRLIRHFFDPKDRFKLAFLMLNINLR